MCEVAPHLVNNADLVPVLQVPADAGEVDFDLDAEFLEVLCRTDAGQHQQLRRVESAAGKDDLPSRANYAFLARAPDGGLVALGLVEMRSVADIRRLRHASVVENDARHQRMKLDRQICRGSSLRPREADRASRTSAPFSVVRGHDTGPSPSDFRRRQSFGSSKLTSHDHDRR